MLQARIQGMFAAHAMAGVTDEMAFGFNFELFTHITRFCGQKVVLLGLYNGQRLHQEPEEDMVTYSRTTQVCLLVSACRCPTGLCQSHCMHYSLLQVQHVSSVGLAALMLFAAEIWQWCRCTL